MNELERVYAIVSEVAFPGYRFQVQEDDSGGVIRTMVRVVYEEPDVMTGVRETQEGRWWLINHGWAPGQIVQTCFKAVLTSLEHRGREHFTWRGRAVLQPHFDLPTLWQMAAPRDHAGVPIPFELTT